MLIVQGPDENLSRVEKLVAILSKCGRNRAALAAIDANLAFWERMAKAESRKRGKNAAR